MKIPHLLAGTAIAVVATVAMSQGAMATPYAFAANQITHLIITYSNGVHVTPSGIPTQTVADSALFDGFALSGFHGSSAVGTAVSIPQAYSGPGPAPASPVFVPEGPPGTFTGARSDAFTGSGSAIVGGVPVDNVAEGFGHGLGTANGNNAATIVFTVPTTGGPFSLTLSFTDAIHLIASTAAFPGETATASITNSFSVTPALGGSPVATFQPAELNQQVSSIQGVPGKNEVTGTFVESFTTPVLTPGTTYNISLSSGSTISFVPAPEPASLAVLGVGLLGLGLLRRRHTG